MSRHFVQIAVCLELCHIYGLVGYTCWHFDSSIFHLASSSESKHVNKNCSEKSIIKQVLSPVLYLRLPLWPSVYRCI